MLGESRDLKKGLLKVIDGMLREGIYSHPDAFAFSPPNIISQTLPGAGATQNDGHYRRTPRGSEAVGSERCS
jgi:hypothetical protein